MRWLRFFVATAGITLGASGQLTAATINVDTVIGPGHSFGDETLTIIDGATPPTDLTILDGAVIGGIPGQSAQDIGIDAFGNSVVHVLGGFVMGVKPILLHDRAVLQMQNGEIGFVESIDSSRAFLNGGDWGAVSRNASRILIQGGGDGSAQAHDASRIVMSSGRPSDIYLFDDATFIMNGGVLGEALVTEGNSRALINSGGASSVVYAKGDSVITFRGGNVTETVVLEDNARLHLYGTDLEFSFDVLQPEIKLVVGFLADGTDVRFSYDPARQHQIILHEVPEPAAAALLAIGAAGWAFFRRRVAG